MVYPSSPQSEPPSISPWLAYPAAFVICFLAAALGSWFTTPRIDGWYAALAKPPFTPPNWVFPVVWPVLFALMAVAAARIAALPEDAPVRKRALILFATQLVLNVAWSFAFFGRESPAAGMLTLVFLFAAIAATLVLFWRLDSVAGALLVPYLAWVGFAGILNASIVALN